MMSHIPTNFEKAIEIFAPAAIGTTLFTLTTFTNIFEWALKILVLLATLGFTLWRWRVDYIRNKKGE